MDFSPLKPHKRQVQKLVKALGKNGPLIIQVDAHNVVPVWCTSPKFEGRAYLIRTKIHNQLDEFLTEFPPLIRHPFDPLGNDQFLKLQRKEIHFTYFNEIFHLNSKFRKIKIQRKIVKFFTKFFTII